jgi:FMN-dependent NADH-azoreductase
MRHENTMNNPMTTILQVNSSLYGEDAQSSRLAAAFVKALRGAESRSRT